MDAAASPLWEILGRPAIFAFVGGGGKTTLTLRAAREAARGGHAVVVTTTTRMMVPCVPDVDEVIFAQDFADAQDHLRKALAVRPGCGRCVALFTGTENSPHGTRAVGVPSSWPVALRGEGLADVVAVEADGSRRLPFKAPRAPQEPVLPTGVAAVVAVAGVDAVGLPLVEERVCRADVVAAVTGAALGDAVSADMVGDVIGCRSLWCRSLTGTEDEHCRFYSVINKVDAGDEIAQTSGTAVADRVLGASPGVDAVILTGEDRRGRGEVMQVRGST